MRKGWAKREDLKGDKISVWFGSESPHHVPKVWQMIPVTVLTADEVKEITQTIGDAVRILKNEKFSIMAKALSDSLRILEGE